MVHIAYVNFLYTSQYLQRFKKRNYTFWGSSGLRKEKIEWAYTKFWSPRELQTIEGGNGIYYHDLSSAEIMMASFTREVCNGFSP